MTSAQLATIQANRAARGQAPLRIEEPPRRGPISTAGPRRATGARNTGRWLEELIQSTADAYRAAGILTLRKVEPPCRIVGTGPARKVIFLDNPWVDHAGAWTERGGRHLVIESKSHAGERLPLGDGGLTHRQIDALRDWLDAGSAALVLWGRSPTDVLAYHPASIFAVQASGRRHLKPGEGLPVHPGEGFIQADFADVLRKLFH